MEILGRPSLPRRDVEFSRCDVIFEALCHVATWNSHVATWNSHVATWNSHVAMWNSHVATSLLHVATSFGYLLCHVATWPRTSRRHLVMFSATSRRGILTSRRGLNPLSVTSRREPERRDVGLFALCHVATSPRTSRRGPVFSPRMVHFAPSPYAPFL